MKNSVSTLLSAIDESAAVFSGQVGLAARRLSDEAEPVLYQAHLLFPTASVIKLAIVAEYLAQAARGRLLPVQPVVIRAEDMVGGSGVIKDLQPGLTLTLHDLATLSITVSDNSAANLLIRAVGGLAAVDARLRALGMANTTLGRPFIFDADSGADNTGTPADFLHLLLRLGQQRLIDANVSRQLLALMRRQQYMLFIPRYLPYHPFAAEYGLPQTVTVANKVGMLPGTVNDAALIETPNGVYALAIFTKNCPDTRPDPDNEAALLVARLAQLVHDHFCQP